MKFLVFAAFVVGVHEALFDHSVQGALLPLHTSKALGLVTQGPIRPICILSSWDKFFVCMKCNKCQYPKCRT
jgi:hypothetical protein